MGKYDKYMKVLMDTNPVAFARFLLYEWQKQREVSLPDTPVLTVKQLSSEFQDEELEGDGLLLLEGEKGPLCLIEVEYQSALHPFMPLRSLEYLARTKKKHWKELRDVPVLAVHIYLFDVKNVPLGPMVWYGPQETVTLAFNFVAIKMSELPREEFLALGEPALWPLALLTNGGVDRILVDRMFADLLENKLYRTLPIAYTVAGWLMKGDDLIWLHEECAKMFDIFNDSPAIGWMEELVRQKIEKEAELQAIERVQKSLREKEEALREALREEEEASRKELREKERALREQEEASRKELWEKERALREQEEASRKELWEKEERLRQREEYVQRYEAMLAMMQDMMLMFILQRFPELGSMAMISIRMLQPERRMRVMQSLSVAQTVEEARGILATLGRTDDSLL